MHMKEWTLRQEFEVYLELKAQELDFRIQMSSVFYNISRFWSCFSCTEEIVKV